MKKHLFLTTIVLALVMCLSFGVVAHDAGNVTGFNDPNDYVIAEQITKGYENDDLWIGTLDAWKAVGGVLGSTDTVMDNGEAIHGDDIIITNGKVAIALAVGTRNPWGYPAGSVLDTGVVTKNNDGKLVGGRDNTWSIEPLINGWDSWAPGNSGQVAFDLVKYDFGNGEIDAVQVTRIYRIGSRSFDIVTYYGMEKGADYAYSYHEITNVGDKASKTSIRFAATNKGDDGGAMFTNKVSASVGSYTVTDDFEYSVGLMMPGTVDTSTGSEVTVGKWGGSVGYKELRIDGVNDTDFDGKYEFAAGEKITFPCAIVISDKADFQKINSYYLDYMDITDITAVSGTTSPNGTVIVKEDGKDYGWFMADEKGTFRFEVPQNDKKYTMYLESNGYVDGEEIAIVNSGNTFAAGELKPGEAKVQMEIAVTDKSGNAIPAKIEVFEKVNNEYVSAYPTVRFNGESVYYNDETKGNIKFEVEPGEYKVVVYGYGYWFYSKAVEVTGNTADYKAPLTAKVDIQYAAPTGWYSSDVHHHANKNDAFSAPADVIKSQAASGLTLGLLTDHDYTTNNSEFDGYVKKYGLEGYMPSEEISCSWAHFNVLTVTDEAWDHFIDREQLNPVMNQFADLQFFVDQTHETGAAITANHPWYSYGLFYAYGQGAIPGGYTDDYDCIEINSSSSDMENTAAIYSTVELWSSLVDGNAIYEDINGDAVLTEKAHYLVGGSDTHDVRYPGFAADDYTNSRGGSWYASGKARTFAYVADLPDNDESNKEAGVAFANAVNDGHSYVSTGPILDIDTNTLPGNAYGVTEKTNFTVDLTYYSVNGIKDIYVLTKDGSEPLVDGAITEINFVSDLYYSYDDHYADGATLKYDKVATEATRATVKKAADGKVSATVTATVTDDTWVAVLVMDETGNFAISNPWWIKSTAFPDVAGDAWYFDAVTFLENLGLVQGNEKGLFEPDKNVTRAEFATMLYNYGMQVNAFDGVTPVKFGDVDSKDQWFYDAVTTLAGTGAINGYPDGNFYPNRTITRAEMASMIYRFLGLNEEFDNQFSDVVNESAWYYNAVTILGGLNIVNGMGDGTFAPAETANRAQAAQIVVNVINFIEG